MNLQKISMKNEVFWIMKSVKISLKPSTKYPVFQKFYPLALDPPKKVHGYATAMLIAEILFLVSNHSESSLSLLHALQNSACIIQSFTSYQQNCRTVTHFRAIPKMCLNE